MNATEQKTAAKKFAEYWKDRGYEKGESQKFWIDLLEHVYGVEDITEFITFFLYQGYTTYIETVYNFRVLATQRLHFQNIEFCIKNKDMILKELDKIGINRKTLFCDYDSIAKYITEKYNVLKKDDELN